MANTEKSKFSVGEKVKFLNCDMHSGVITNVSYNEKMRDNGYSGWLYDFDPKDGRSPYIEYEEESLNI